MIVHIISRRFGLAAIIVVTAICMGSCAHVRQWMGHDEAGASVVTVDAAPAVSSTADPEASLREAIRKRIESGARDKELVYKNPYWFKEYEEFPRSPDDFTVVFRETESRTAPYAADVTLKKIRYATPLHSKKEAAKEDDQFLRETGVATETYEFRNGRWVNTGSVFIAEKIERNVNGQWAPYTPAEQPAPAQQAHEDRGPLQRAWNWITGR